MPRVILTYILLARAPIARYTAPVRGSAGFGAGPRLRHYRPDWRFWLTHKVLLLRLNTVSRPLETDSGALFTFRALQAESLASV